MRHDALDVPVAARGRRAFASVVLGGLCAAAVAIGSAGCAGSKAPPRSPESEVASRVRMAQAYLNAGRMPDALRAMQEAIELDPDAAGLRNFYGQICFLAGRYEEAEASYLEALELDPYLTDAHNNLGALYDETGREREAEAEYLAALEDPAYATPEKVYLNLGVLYASQGRVDEAVRALRRAVEIDPKYLRAHYELAGLLDRQGRLEEAASEYEVAAPGYRDTGEFHYRLGFVYFRLGDRARADEHFRRVVELAPGSETAARATELLNMLR